MNDHLYILYISQCTTRYLKTYESFIQFKIQMNITSFTNEQSLYQRMLKFKGSRLYAGGVCKRT